MPNAGAASSSSRVAIANLPMRISWKKWATTSATKAPTHSQVLPSSRGMPDRPPAPRVRSSQFLTSWSTMNSAASVIIVGARPLARATAMPKTPPMMTVTTTANSVAPNGFRKTSSRPKGMSGSALALVANGMATTAVAYAAIWANAMWPKLSTPVLPMNTCMPSTRMKLLSISAISESRLAPPPLVYAIATAATTASNAALASVLRVNRTSTKLKPRITRAPLWTP